MPRILLVEDSKLFKLATQRILAKAGHEVLTAEDGEEALRMAKKSIPDLILLDMLLPKLDGPQVLSQLKTNAATSPIPVVVLSGLSDKNGPKLLQAGASAFIAKDKYLQDAEYLLDVIGKLLSSSSLPLTISAPANPLELAAQ